MQSSSHPTSFQTYLESGGHEERILVVDDEESVREVLSVFFTDRGYQVVTAENGKDALSKFNAGAFDCILSDVSMPEMDGMELLKRIRNVDDDVVFLIITGYPALESAVEAIKLGAYDYITKPFNLKDIALKVERALYTLHLEGSLKESAGKLRKLLLIIPFIIIILLIVAWLIWWR